MIKPDWSVQRSEVERVAQEFRDKGYQVVVEPQTPDVPEFIREYQPDIIARRMNDSVVIEVKQQASDAERERIRALAKRVEGQPGWRFVLVSPRPQEGGFPRESVGPLAATQIRDLLNEAKALRQASHNEAALLVAWAAVEAAMRLAARQHSLDIQRPDTWSLMRELVTNGLVDRDCYHELSDLFRFRSAVAHGFEPAQEFDLDRAVQVAVSTAEQILSESEGSVSKSPA